MEDPFCEQRDGVELASVPMWSYKKNPKKWGTDVVKTMDDCIKTCEQTTGCVSISWNEAAKKCWGFNRQIEKLNPIESDDFVSVQLHGWKPVHECGTQTDQKCQHLSVRSFSEKEMVDAGVGWNKTSDGSTLEKTKLACEKLEGCTGVACHGSSGSQCYALNGSLNTLTLWDKQIEGNTINVFQYVPCGKKTPVADVPEGFTVIRDGSIAGGNDEILRNKSLAECAGICKERDWCKSFDFIGAATAETRGECYLSKSNKKKMQSNASWNGNTPGWDYFELIEEEKKKKAKSVSGFKLVADHSLGGKADETFEETDALQCAQKCLENKWCASFSMKDNTCQLSKRFETKDAKLARADGTHYYERSAVITQCLSELYKSDKQPMATPGLCYGTKITGTKEEHKDACEKSKGTFTDENWACQFPVCPAFFEGEPPKCVAMEGQGAEKWAASEKELADSCTGAGGVFNSDIYECMFKSE